MVHHFIAEVIKEICPDPKVLEQLWDNFLLEELHKSYKRAMDQAKWLLEIEREGNPLTMNHYFNDNLQKVQNERLITGMKKLWNSASPESEDTEEKGVFLTWSQLSSWKPVNKANSDHVREYMHDVLKSYYKVSRKRFVDVVCQQAVNHFLLRGPSSPLKIFTTDMVLGLNADQLDMIAAEDAPVRELRNKLGRDIDNFEEALKVLKGSG